MLPRHSSKIALVSGIATAVALAAMVAATPIIFQTAAAVTTPADDCRNAIQTALADRRISSSEMQAIKVECANGAAPSGCLSTIQAARADGRITAGEVTAIKEACGLD